MVAPPGGTVTLLFTEIERSTRLLHELGDGYMDVLAVHRRAVRKAILRQRGVEVDQEEGIRFFSDERPRYERLVASSCKLESEAVAEGRQTPLDVPPRTHSSRPGNRGCRLRRLLDQMVRRLFQERAPGSSREGGRGLRSSPGTRPCRAQPGEVVCLRRSSR